MIELILSKLWPVFALIASLIGVYFYGRRDGKVSSETKGMEKAIERSNTAGQIAKEVRDEIRTMSDDDVVAELERDWMRKPKGK